MANINIPFNCDYESINITVKCPIEGTDREEQTIIAQLKKDQNDWVFCTPGSIVSKNVKILNNEGSYEVIDSNGNFKGKIVGDILSDDGKVIVSVTENKITTNDLVVSKDTIVNNLTINGKLTVKNGLDKISVSESSVSGNSSIVVLDNTNGNNMGLVVKNGMESEFLGFSKENNMFEIVTGASLVDDKVVGGQYGDLKARTIIADDVILGNKNKGETVINIHDVITGDEKGTAHITTNSMTTVHHSSVFHTAISYDQGFANSENKFLNSLSGDIKTTFISEKIGGTFDGNLGNKYPLSELEKAVSNNNKDGTILTSDFNKITKGNRGESYNQHWLTINEADKNPKFQWWVASKGNFSAGAQKNSVHFKNVFTVEKSGINIQGSLNLQDDNDSCLLTVSDVKQLKNMATKKAGSTTLLQVSSNSSEIDLIKQKLNNINQKSQTGPINVSELENTVKENNNLKEKIKNLETTLKSLVLKINTLENSLSNNTANRPNLEVESLKKRIEELETKKTIVKQNGDEVVIDNSEVVNQYKNLESRFNKYERAMPVLQDLSKETINKLVSKNAELEGYKSFPVIVNSKDNKKVQILNCRNFPNGQVHYYQLDGITANISDYPIINLSDQVKNIKEKLDKREKVLPIVEEINELTNEGNSTPYLFVQKDKTNPEKMTIKFINKFKSSDKDPAVHYFYQLNGDGLNNSSSKTIDDETTKDLIQEYENFLPVHKEGEAAPSKDGPYIHIEGDGSVKLVNYKNGEKYYYQLNGN